MAKKNELIQSVKGTRDLLPSETPLWQRVEEEARKVFEAYNFREIRTPVLEQTALFARSVGSDTDIVTKEMYTFEDRDSESLTLRPEATASVVRAYIEHGLYNQGGIQKLYYFGPMFRRERPQKGRYRQFYQIGAEVLGSEHPAIDAEVLEMLVLLLERLGLKEFKLLLNSVGCSKCRPEYLKTLRKALDEVKDRLCTDCRRRSHTNPLRVLDCKIEADQPIIEKLPTILEHLCPECRQHFDSVTLDLKQRRVDFEIVPRLVRGLDYYTRTTFEITSGLLGAQNALLGGGRYDGLSEMLGGPPAPGFGFAIGQDRLVLTLETTGTLKLAQPLAVYIAWLGDAAREPSLLLARELRRQGIGVEISYHQIKLKKAMGAASKLQAPYTLIIGEDEVASGSYQVKNMQTGEQTSVSAGEIAGFLKEKLREPSQAGKDPAEQP
ncbi:MAG TPA: histidine--tRNA ligase [Terriglobia bacterium]|nr:histidine--tRNA ligase [Terriglobia bacterium]